MKTLGIDPGTAIMGFGLVTDSERSLKALEFGCIRTTKENLPHERLRILYEKLGKLLKELRPDCIAIERLFFATNSKTAISVGEARGVALLAAARAKVVVAEYTPLQVKLAITGYGKADKNQVGQMVKNLLKLEEVPKPDDTADALAIAICHLHSYHII
ncbi:crossover junction endodeoxyribonuclease RuvC [Candidatus Saganbacteria bacterium]|nr:crossover junction endodeoxyribonuclease RuvC [Candidatus Saganbacteria bacterium]